MSIDVFVADEQDAEPVELERWATLARAVMTDEGLRGDVELSVLFVAPEVIAELNQRFLGRSGPTDVLAFPIDEEPEPAGRSPDAGGAGPGWAAPEERDLPFLLGDVVICPEVARRNAPEHAGSYDDEIALLVVHGILHLRGHDHEQDDQAALMESREAELLDRYHRGGEPGPPATR